MKKVLFYTFCGVFGVFVNLQFFHLIHVITQ